MKIDVIKKKKAMLEILEDLFERIERDEKCQHTQYKNTGRQEQVTKWNKETKQYDPVFDDDGNPVMTDIWEDVEVPESELSDIQKAKIEAYGEIIKALEKLL